MQGNQDWEKGREERERLEEEKLEEEEERLEKWLKKEKKKTDYIVVGPISKDFYKDTGAFCSLGRGQIKVPCFSVKTLHVSSLAGKVHLIPRPSGRRKRGG